MIKYITRLLSSPCKECKNKICIPDWTDCDLCVDAYLLDEFLNEMGWTEDYFLDYLKYENIQI